MSDARVVIDDMTAKLRELGTSPAGPVFRHFVALGAEVHTGAVGNLSGRMANVRTGNLRASGHTLTQVEGATVRQIVEFTAPYALAVHNGTKPHMITPKNKQILAWQGPAGPMFASSVNHPGTKPRPFLHDSLAQTMLAH